MEKEDIKLNKTQQTQFDNLKLIIELIPRSNWNNNVRSILTKKQWDKIRNEVFTKADYKCEICNGIGTKHHVECYEVWHYDIDNKVQTLIKLISICPLCHQVIHIGLTAKIKKENGLRAYKRFQEINKLTDDEAKLFYNYSCQLWTKRSKIKWKLDLKHLKNYNINIKDENDESCPNCIGSNYTKIKKKYIGKSKICKCYDCNSNLIFISYNYYYRKKYICYNCKSYNVFPLQTFKVTYKLNKCNDCGNRYYTQISMSD